MGWAWGTVERRLVPNRSVFSTFGENESSPVALLQTLTCKILCQLTLRLLVFQEG